MLDIIKTEKAYKNKKSLKGIFKDYEDYYRENHFWIMWDIQAFKVLLKHFFESDFTNGWWIQRFKVLLKHAYEDVAPTSYPKASGGLLNPEEAWFEEEAAKFVAFFLDKGYLKEVEVETDDEYETEKTEAFKLAFFLDKGYLKDQNCDIQ